MNFFSDFEFYWIRENIVAGSSRPQSVEDIKFIIEQGIKRIISISEPGLIQNIAKGLPIEIIPFEFDNYGVPSNHQLQDYLNIMQNSIKEHKPVLIHCAMGCGRTGLLLTAYLMNFENKDWETSLLEVREIRSCAVESSIQLKYLSSLNIEKKFFDK